MNYRRNILDPPEGLTASQRKRWIDSFKRFRTMINGEEFWDEVMERNKRGEGRAYEFNQKESLVDLAEEIFWASIGCPD